MSSEASLLFAACPLPHDEQERILLGHGSGGRLSARLIERTILAHLRNPILERLEDQAVLEIGAGERIALTTDSFVVRPLFFPGGDIGSLAVHGTVNDLAVGGARPLALSLAFILEEGFPIASLERVLRSISEAARRVGVPVVTGDTKVVERGKGDGLFVNTTGVGIVPFGLRLGASRVAPGDAILLSGTIGDHGITILAQREALELEGSVESDTAPLHELAAAILAAAPNTHAMRDPTRGGLAATLVEVASRASVGIAIREADLPVRDAVRGACELLGLDPLHVANEGKLVAFVPEEEADAALEAMRAHPLGREARRIGHVVQAHAGQVRMRTWAGGERIVDLPWAEPLPRIC